MLDTNKAMALATLTFVVGTHSMPFLALAQSHGEQHRLMKEYILQLESENLELQEDCEKLENQIEQQQISIDKLVASEQELTAKLKAIEVAKEEKSRTIESNAPETTTTPSSNEWVEVKIEATFYTSLPEENGAQYAGMNALGGTLHTGSLAVPKEIPLGTEFIIDGLPSAVGTNTFVADDRGGAIKMKGDTMKVDVFVARLSGESDSQYHERVNDLGRIVTTGRYRRQ